MPPARFRPMLEPLSDRTLLSAPALSAPVPVALVTPESSALVTVVGNNDGSGQVVLHSAPASVSPSGPAGPGGGASALLLAQPGSTNLDVLFSDGQGHTVLQPALAVGPGVFEFRLSDVNNSGLADLVVSNPQTGWVSVYLNPGDGRLLPASGSASTTGILSVSTARDPSAQDSSTPTGKLGATQATEAVEDVEEIGYVAKTRKSRQPLPTQTYVVLARTEVFPAPGDSGEGETLAGEEVGEHSHQPDENETIAPFLFDLGRVLPLPGAGVPQPGTALVPLSGAHVPTVAVPFSLPSRGDEPSAVKGTAGPDDGRRGSEPSKSGAVPGVSLDLDDAVRQHIQSVQGKLFDVSSSPRLGDGPRLRDANRGQGPAGSSGDGAQPNNANAPRGDGSPAAVETGGWSEQVVPLFVGFLNRRVVRPVPREPATPRTVVVKARPDEES